MFNLRSIRNIGIPLYLFIYLIFPYSAITQTKNSDLRWNLENALNSKNLEFILDSFKNDESLIISKKVLEIIQDFPSTKWSIKKLQSKDPNKNIFQIRVIGKRIDDDEVYMLESNFKYLFSILNGKIAKGFIKDLFTIIRNDNNRIDISFRIPDVVLTGAKYDIDIVLNKPLGEAIIAGGIKPHQVESFLEQEIKIEPLVSGGIFKFTRAPSKPGIQIWSGIIAHPEGMVTFTKSIDIVEEI